MGGEENTAAAVILATGMDTCRNRTVTAEANCSGAINPSAYPGVIAVTLSEGTATVTWLGRQGATYVLQCKDSLLDPIWVDVPGLVTGNGLPASKTDAVGPTRRRFYRVMTREE